jgi:hypothetical protein
MMGSIHVSTVVHRDDGYGALHVVDSVDDAEVATPSRVMASEVEMQFSAHTPGVNGQGSRR